MDEKSALDDIFETIFQDEALNPLSEIKDFGMRRCLKTYIQQNVWYHHNIQIDKHLQSTFSHWEDYEPEECTEFDNPFFCAGDLEYAEKLLDDGNRDIDFITEELVKNNKERNALIEEFKEKLKSAIKMDMIFTYWENKLFNLKEQGKLKKFSLNDLKENFLQSYEIDIPDNLDIYIAYLEKNNISIIQEIFPLYFIAIYDIVNPPHPKLYKVRTHHKKSDAERDIYAEKKYSDFTAAAFSKKPNSDLQNLSDILYINKFKITEALKNSNMDGTLDEKGEEIKHTLINFESFLSFLENEKNKDVYNKNLAIWLLMRYSTFAKVVISFNLFKSDFDFIELAYDISDKEKKLSYYEIVLSLELVKREKDSIICDDGNCLHCIMENFSERFENAYNRFSELLEEKLAKFPAHKEDCLSEEEKLNCLMLHYGNKVSESAITNIISVLGKNLKLFESDMNYFYIPRNILSLLESESELEDIRNCIVRLQDEYFDNIHEDVIKAMKPEEKIRFFGEKFKYLSYSIMETYDIDKNNVPAIYEISKETQKSWAK